MMDYVIVGLILIGFIYVVIRTEQIVKARRTESSGPGDTVYHEDEEEEDDSNAHLNK